MKDGGGPPADLQAAQRWLGAEHWPAKMMSSRSAGALTGCSMGDASFRICVDTIIPGPVGENYQKRVKRSCLNSK